MDAISYKTHSPKQTKAIAELLAREILRKKLKIKSALVLALKGNLGAGKTTFIQGFIRGAGIKKRITSPTFVIIKNYKLQTKNYKLIYHIDCYRLNSDAQRGRSTDLAERREKTKEILDLGLKEILADSDSIVLIEWPEKIKKYLPKNHLLIKFTYGKKENERRIVIT